METQRVQFLEANGEWVNVVVTNDSRVAHALLGAEGKVYDNLRKLYRYKPEPQVEKPENPEIMNLLTDLQEVSNCVTFLLNAYDLWSSEGTFTFPNGRTFYKEVTDDATR